MTQSGEVGARGGEERETALESALSALVERQRALHSAWGVLAPSGLSAAKCDIAETGRALSDVLTELAARSSPTPDSELIAATEARLDSLESRMREVALAVPIAQLRATISECISQKRRGVLDLLDLMLGADRLGLDGTEMRIPSIDSLITLLCGVGSGRPPRDPVQLTTRLRELCDRSAVDYDPRLPAIEAEFFHAADMYEADACGGPQLRALQMRKAELGSSYFAPQVLRAIVTYNIALLQRIDEEVLNSLDWGSLPTLAEEPEQTASVFETTALARLAQALRRRSSGQVPGLSAIDRIAWCLDLEYPTAEERRALLTESVGRADALSGTVVLVGLLCRASVVLEDEFPDIGISPTQLFESWIPELSAALQKKVNQGIAGDDYREACTLSELKTRYLYASMSEMRRMNRTRAPTPLPDAADMVAAAKVAEAVKTSRASKAAKAADETAAGTSKRKIRESRVDANTAAVRTRRSTGTSWSTRRLAAIGMAIALLGAGIGRGFFWGGERMRLDRAQLDRVSPYLANGVRDGRGRGSAFVGEIGEDWSALEASDRTRAANELVAALRESGVRDVMIYDADGMLRIQALGEQSSRVLPGDEGER